MQTIVLENIKSVILIDSNDLDNFINHKILENYGITEIISFKSASDALSYIKETDKKYQLILVDIYMPLMGGFEFIDKFHELKLDKIQGEICLLSASLNPLYKMQAEDRCIKFIEKPLTIEKTLTNRILNNNL